jgi:hypothetical protein
MLRPMQVAEALRVAPTGSLPDPFSSRYTERRVRIGHEEYMSITRSMARRHTWQK